MKITQHSKGKKDAFATFLIVSLLKKNMMELLNEHFAEEQHLQYADCYQEDSKTVNFYGMMCSRRFYIDLGLKLCVATSDLSLSWLILKYWLHAKTNIQTST